MSRETAAQTLGLSLSTIDRAVRTGRLRSHRPPGMSRRLIPVEAIDEFVQGDSLASVHVLDERRRK